MSKKSSSTVISRREDEIAREKARIRLELLDRELASLKRKRSRSSRSAQSEHTTDSQYVERWLEHNEQELGKYGACTEGTTAGPVLPPMGIGTVGPVQQLAAAAPPPGEAGTDGAIMQLVAAMKELVTTTVASNNNTNNNLLSRISTPKELPPFYGDPTEWLAFKQAYEESTSLCNFSDRENVWRLRRCLRGPARETVAALLMTAAAPRDVMATLELQFGNAEVILSKIMTEIKKLNSVSPEYQKDIVPFSIKVKNYVAAVRALRRDEYLEGVSVVNIVLSKLPTVLVSKWADYSYPLITKGCKSRLDIISDFLNEEAVKISTCGASLMNVRDTKRIHKENSNFNQPQTVLVQSAQYKDRLDEKCQFCRVSKHILTDCKKFRRSLRKYRWAFVKRTGLCFKCLTAQHDRQTCPAAACDVDSCGEAHHRLLHYVPSPRQNNVVAVQVTQTENADTESESPETVTHINSNRCSVLLKVVNINIHGPNGVINATALLDDGSTVSLISAALAERAGLRGRPHALRVRGAWDNTDLVCDTEILDFELSNKHGKVFKVSARSVKELNLPEQNLSVVNCENYKYLSELKGELCTSDKKPEVLIGQDNFHLLLPLEVRSGSQREPCATRTPLGWAVHGRVVAARSPPAPPPASHATLFITDVDASDTRNENLHEFVRRSFEIESMGVSAASKPRQNKQDERAWEHLEHTSRLVNGQWHVGLPWKDKQSVMPDSYTNAIARLKGVEKKMNLNEEYAARYKERIQHLLSNDFAEELKECKVGPRTWYLPHFGVDNPNKKKLRLVFDAAAQSSGSSLNDYLLKGPDLLMSLFGILLRFRENKIAVTGDIKDMFLRVKIQQEDRDALRFVFRDNPDGKAKNLSQKLSADNENPVKTYVMSSLIFGANCSPFIAQFIKNKNARRFESSMPAAAAAVCYQHYMDDYIHSVPDEATAITLIKQVTYIHSQGSFEIRNWNSNSERVLSSVPKEALCETAVKFKMGQQYDGERTLGLICPHWGGAWERLIRSVKTSLKVVLKERAPRDETLSTLLAEVENIVNSRPLTHVSVEAGSIEALTPNHFLIGSSSNLPQMGVFDDSDLHLRKQWRIAQRLTDMFWKRWVREVLPEMIPRKKWTKEARPLQVGDLVYVVDPDGPRNLWVKGLVNEKSRANSNSP
ncbi:uncharacterized protein LOC125489919 [Plutella xylostella]|uniref:uncharacterized protein LOC125489919 n=1 Tax=Plutella xylostella TaxID=51655 RepID=UPI002032EF01|nr:uncharacterized protein LOC125489919 [Plutella xylostella]